MKKLIVGIGALLATSAAIAQTEYSTNKEGSEYKFEKIVHLDATPVQSQGWTGTCWSFSALSFFESELKRIGHGDVVLAEMWIARFAYLGKANKYVRTDGNTNFDEGGAFHDIPWVIKRYGIVPLEAYKGINYGITIKGSDRIIGTVGFWNMSKPDGRAEIGYMLHGDFHQKGIMPEALTAVLKYGFEKMNLHSVEARVHPENSPSIRVLLKKGFKKEAHFRQNYFFEGAFLDTVAFGLLKSEY